MMFHDISCDKKDNEEECVANVKVVSILAKKFGIGHWSFIGPSSEKKWCSVEENSPQGIWDKIAEKWNSQKADVQFSVQHLHCPGISSKAKDTANCLYILLRIKKTIETISPIIVFAIQLNLHGAVANICEEYESFHDRSGQSDVLMGQSIVLSEIKVEDPLENDIPSHQNLLLQRYEERIEILSQENKMSKFCLDEGFLKCC